MLHTIYESAEFKKNLLAAIEETVKIVSSKVTYLGIFADYSTNDEEALKKAA
jgi:hypothetical protein